MDDNWLNQKVIAYYPELCTGCRLCEVVCAFRRYGSIDLTKSCLKISLSGDENTAAFEAVNCQHCEEPICVSACPSEALAKDERTGWVKINSLKCVGCQTCLYTCPLSVPFFHEELKVAVKCDFCGGEPECVKHCSPGALRVVPREEAIQSNKRLYSGVS
jgi:Fe-S-cluster-containing dehydrogenase component